MRLKHIEYALSSVRREFDDPDVTLEQYPTNPYLTAAVMLAALEYDDVGPGRCVLDLGCGTGMLSLGCAVVDSDHVIGVDCDPDALQKAAMNIAELDFDDRISLVLAKVHIPCELQNQKSKNGRNRSDAKSKARHGIDRTPDLQKGCPIASFPLREDCVDTVVTNPPFGTKPNKAGIDMQFLQLGCRLARHAVYSFHKSSTRDYIIRVAKDLPNVASAKVIAEMKFDLPRTYKFHQHSSVNVEVVLVRVELRSSGEKAETST